MRISDLLANEAPHDASAQIPSGKLRRGAAVREDFLRLKPKAGEGATIRRQTTRSRKPGANLRKETRSQKPRGESRGPKACQNRTDITAKRGWAVNSLKRACAKIIGFKFAKQKRVSTKYQHEAHRNREAVVATAID